MQLPADARTRRYAAIVLLVLVAGLVPVGVANVLIDPYWRFDGLALDQMHDFQTKRATRTWKAQAIARLEPGTVLIGSSRVEVGFRPGHQVFAGERAFNAGLLATNMHELQFVYDFTRRTAPLRRVLLGLDFLLFGDVRRTGQDFGASLFNPELDRTEYELGLLLSRRALGASLDVLAARRRGERPEDGPDGWRNLDLREHARTPRERFEATLSRFATDPELFDGFTLGADRFDALRAVLGSCEADGTDVVIVIPPVHALHLVMIEKLGLWDEFESWKRRVMEIATETGAGGFGVCDAALITERTEEAVPPEGETGEMHWFVESSHCTWRLGDRVLEQVYGAGAGPDVTPLTPGSIDAHLDAQRRALDAYIQAHPDQVMIVESAIGAAP